MALIFNACIIEFLLFHVGELIIAAFVSVVIACMHEDTFTMLQIEKMLVRL